QLNRVEEEIYEASSGGGGLPKIWKPAGMDDPGCHSCPSSGTQTFGSSRWGQIRNVRFERSLSARNQPEQPAEAPAGAKSPERDYPERETNAAGSGGCTL